MNVVLVPSGGTYVPQYTTTTPSYGSSVPIHIPTTTRVPSTTYTPTTRVPVPTPTTRVPVPTPTTRVPVPTPTTRVPLPTPAPAPSPAPTPAPTGITLSSDERSMINMVNQQRAAAGVPPVKVDSRLMTVGRQKAQDMKANNYFGHISPTYGSPWAQMQSVGLTVKWAAENITAERTVAGAMSNFMKSSGHRANILDSRFTHIGVGIAYGTSYGNIYVQEFLQE